MGSRTAGWVIAAALLALPATSYAQAAPVNDNYLDSLRLNDPGTRLERRDTLRDTQNTTNATVQSDVFSPPQSGGPPKLTTCEGASIGKTVWYDFYPDVSGLVRLRASGYDTLRRRAVQPQHRAAELRPRAVQQRLEQHDRGVPRAGAARR